MEQLISSISESIQLKVIATESRMGIDGIAQVEIEINEGILRTDRIQNSSGPVVMMTRFDSRIAKDTFSGESRSDRDIAMLSDIGRLSELSIGLRFNALLLWF